MNTNIIRSEERGFFNHGWLKTYHTFSFADYYNPQSMNFGVLRVLNDDQIMPGNGFGMHSHSNMEIITIPLSGILEHEDTTGEKGAIKPNEVQVMSAGTGIMHSEKNGGDDIVSLLQIWIMPHERSIKPLYEQRLFDPSLAIDNNQLLVSGEGLEKSLKIFQNASISRRFVSNENSFNYTINTTKNGLFIFVIEGSLVLNKEKLKRRDSIAIIPDDSPISIASEAGSYLLFIEVPLL